MRERLSYANVMATVALFIALGGSSYAAVRITGANVKDGTITGADIKDNSLRGHEIRTGATAPTTSGTGRCGRRTSAPGRFQPVHRAEGRQGRRGAQGAKGETGARAPKGDSGAPGPPGAAGSPGETGTGVDAMFGDGSDGDVTVNGATTLSRDTYYDDLTIAAGETLDPGRLPDLRRGDVDARCRRGHRPERRGRSRARRCSAGACGGDARRLGRRRIQLLRRRRRLYDQLAGRKRWEGRLWGARERRRARGQRRRRPDLRLRDPSAVGPHPRREPGHRWRRWRQLRRQPRRQRWKRRRCRDRGGALGERRRARADHRRRRRQRPGPRGRRRRRRRRRRRGRHLDGPSADRAHIVGERR